MVMLHEGGMLSHSLPGENQEKSIHSINKTKPHTVCVLGMCEMNVVKTVFSQPQVNLH